MGRSGLDFRRIDFGYAEARFEFEQAPKLLRNGYFDLGNSLEKVIHGHEFLVLGYKGSGKSAIGAKLRILALDSPSLYHVPKAISVADMSLATFKGIIPESFDALQRYTQAWHLLLLCGLVGELASDGRADEKARESALEARALLTSQGIQYGSPGTLRKLRTARVTSKLAPVKHYERTKELEPTEHENSLKIWLSYLSSICESFKSARAHFNLS